MGCLLKQGGGLYPRLRIGAVLLACRPVRRAGGVPSALVTLQGVPLIRRQLVALSGAGVDEVVVVTGEAREAIEAQVATFPVRIVHDPAHEEGAQGSARVGLAALEGPFDAVFVMPAGQPLVGTNDLVELIGAFKKRPHGHVVVPVVGARHGNPILLDAVALARLRDETLAGDDDGADPLYLHATGNIRFITDLDTADDLRQLAEQTGWRLELPALEVTP